MSQQSNMEAQEKFGAAINSGNLSEFKHLMSPDVIDHDPAPTQAPGPEGFIGFFTELREAFPDLQIDVEHAVEDENNISIAYTITGTHRGSFMGIPPTGREITARGMQITRFVDSKIVERWGSSDQLGILQQLGASVIA
jgi:steroid delta-isomerase-like uncharacterized protein